MKRFGWILAILMLVSPAWAAKRVTVQQLEELLSASKNKPDVEVANQLSDLELTERLSAARFSTLKAGLPGEKAQQALLALADQSQFMPPLASEIPTTAAPDFAAQRQMIHLVVAYVSKSIPLLPNLFANRVTISYEDTPHMQGTDYFIPYQPLHHIGNSSVTVLYRDGREVVDTGAAKEVKSKGLTTWGVFGPILGTVLEDAARSKLAWGHWEQGASGPLAVFDYAVPKEKSHYTVDYCCIADQANNSRNDADLRPFNQIVAYHGEIAVDPASGTILRLLLDAEMKASDPVAKASIVVDYGPVEIGGKTYICPVKSISRTLAQTLQFDPRYHFALADTLQPLKISLNDIVFDQYHMFRADTRLLAENDTAGASSAPAAANSANAAENSPAAANPAATETSAPASSVSPSAPAVSAAETAPTAPSASAPDNEIHEEEARGLPEATANASQSMPSGFTIQSVSRLVDVGVVAVDKKGLPIRDLKQSDFEVLDNGRKQDVKFFSQAVEEAPAAAPAVVAESAPSTPVEPVFSNGGASDAKKDAGKPESNTTILLIDSSNLSFGDLSYARSETMRFLKALPADERVGLYVLRSHDFQILAEETADHSLLEEKLSHWMPRAQDLQNAQQDEMRNRQQFEEVHNISDLSLVNGNTISDVDTIRTASTLDPALRDWGSDPGRDAMMIMVGVARHLASISGHKSLVWISSDNALVDWSNQSVSIEKGDKHIEPNTLKAQEAMNDAHVSVYPLDASQLEGGGIDSSVRHRNVVLTQAAMDNAGMRGSPGSTSSQNGTDVSIGRDLAPGRIMAQMQQDMRPIQGPIRHLADATGGQVFRRSGGISDELKGVVEDGHATYQLSFYPDTPADGQFHTISVKLTSYRKGVSLRYRTGYMYAKEPATLKERFQQAVWLPADANQIVVTAQPVAFQGGLRVKISVAANDLALAEKDGHWNGNVDVFLVQRDDPGQRAQVEGRRLGLDLKPPTFYGLLKSGLTVERTVQLKPSITSLRILVVDENSGRMGSVTIPAASLSAGK